MRLRTAGLATILALTLLLVAGCGTGKSVSQRAAEKAAGGLLSAVIGEEVEIDTAKDGSSLSIKGGDGDIFNFSADEGEVPDGFPLPVKRGWQPEGFATMTIEGNLGWHGQFKFAGDARRAAHDYAAELEGMGWEVNTHEIGTGDDETLAVTLGVQGESAGQQYAGSLVFRDSDSEVSLAVTISEADYD